MTAFSILYAPQELACDSSATARVTADLNGIVVGTAATNMQAGTWPSETLQFRSARGFNRVVVHYDKPPVTRGDWGPIFMADNKSVSPAPPALVLSPPTRLANGAFQFGFTNTPNAHFTVFGTTNLALSFSAWTVLAGLTEGPPGQYQFTDPQATNVCQRFYRVTSP